MYGHIQGKSQSRGAPPGGGKIAQNCYQMWMLKYLKRWGRVGLGGRVKTDLCGHAHTQKQYMHTYVFYGPFSLFVLYKLRN